jgi:hypothetical protein
MDIPGSEKFEKNIFVLLTSSSDADKIDTSKLFLEKNAQNETLWRDMENISGYTEKFRVS